MNRTADRRTVVTMMLAGLLCGCAGPSVRDYAAERPTFDLRRYFDGTVTAHGMVSDFSGKVVRRFVVTLHCEWQGDTGRLDEAFVYSDGERQRRVWQVHREADGRFSGTAADVVGRAVGEQAGSAFNWRYTLRVPVGDTTYDLQFDDWMFQIDARTVLNRATMRKFGLRVGEVTLAFTKGEGA